MLLKRFYASLGLCYSIAITYTALSSQGLTAQLKPDAKQYTAGTRVGRPMAEVHVRRWIPRGSPLWEPFVGAVRGMPSVGPLLPSLCVMPCPCVEIEPAAARACSCMLVHAHACSCMLVHSRAYSCILVHARAYSCHARACSCMLMHARA